VTTPLHTVLAQPNKKLVFLLELELTYRIESKAWTQDPSPNTNCYWMEHGLKGVDFEGPPSRVRACVKATHAITTYAPELSLVACQAAPGSWYYDDATGRLHVHASGGDSPGSGAYLLSSHFWIYFCNAQYPDPNTIFFNSRYYQPRLSDDSIPEATLAIKPFSAGGITQTWGDLILRNETGAYDAALQTYVWEACQFFLKCGVLGASYSDYVPIYRGRTGQITWSDTILTISADDQAVAEF
jgi:hypothetical protein